MTRIPFDWRRAIWTKVARAAARLRAHGVQLRDTGAAVELDDPWGNLVRLSA